VPKDPARSLRSSLRCGAYVAREGSSGRPVLIHPDVSHTPPQPTALLGRLLRSLPAVLIPRTVSTRGPRFARTRSPARATSTRPGARGRTQSEARACREASFPNLAAEPREPGEGQACGAVRAGMIVTAVTLYRRAFARLQFQAVKQPRLRPHPKNNHSSHYERGCALDPSRTTQVTQGAERPSNAASPGWSSGQGLSR